MTKEDKLTNLNKWAWEKWPTMTKDPFIIHDESRAADFLKIDPPMIIRDMHCLFNVILSPALKNSNIGRFTEHKLSDFDQDRYVRLFAEIIHKKMLELDIRSMTVTANYEFLLLITDLLIINKVDKTKTIKSCYVIR